jgi:hypothetical protein
MLVIGGLRIVNEIRAEHRRLRTSGQLDELLAARRIRLEAVRIDRLRRRFAVPVPVPVPVTSAATANTVRVRPYASVHVGNIGGIDVDDIGLLAAAMQRARPIERFPGSDATPAAKASGRRALLARACGIVILMSAAAASIAVLTRPLSDESPHVAMAAAALGAAGWLLTRDRGNTPA